MAAGFSVGGVCYASVDEAVDAYYSGIPAFFLPGSTTIKVQFLKSIAGPWFQWNTSYTSAGVATVNYTVAAQTGVYGSCALPNSSFEQFSDGMTLGWGVVAAMIAAWAIMALKKGF